MMYLSTVNKKQRNKTMTNNGAYQGLQICRDFSCYNSDEVSLSPSVCKECKYYYLDKINVGRCLKTIIGDWALYHSHTKRG